MTGCNGSDTVDAAPDARAQASRLEQLIRRSVCAEVGTRLDKLHRMVERMQEQIAAMAGPAAMRENLPPIEPEVVTQAMKPQTTCVRQVTERFGLPAPASARSTDVDGISIIRNDVGDIFSAASFQDLTSRRIRQAIAQLQQVDSMLDNLGAGVRLAAGRPGCEPWPRTGVMAADGADLLQAEIDRLMAF